MTQKFQFWVYTSKEFKAGAQRDIFTPVFM